MPTTSAELEARAAARRAAFKLREAQRAERMEQLKTERLAQMTSANATGANVQKGQLLQMDVHTLYNHVANQSGIIMFDTRRRELFDENHIVGSLWLDHAPLQTLYERQQLLAVKSDETRADCKTLLSANSSAEDLAPVRPIIQAIPSSVRHRFLNRSHHDGPVVVVCGGAFSPETKTKDEKQSTETRIAEALNTMFKIRACYVLTIPVAQVVKKLPLLVVPTSPNSSQDRNSQRTCHFFPSLVIPGLFLGSAQTASDRRVFEMLGIRRVVNITENVPNYFEDTGAGIQYLNIAITDAPDAAESLASALQGAIEFVAETINEADSADSRSPPCEKQSAELPASAVSLGNRDAVLVHCEFGVSRSASVVIAYLMQKNGWSFEKSYDFLQTRRPKVKPNLGFRDVLRRMHKAKKPGNCKSP